jgi:hypothetical protein
MSILFELKEYAHNYELQAMNTLVESLSPAELEENKQEIIEVYNMVYADGMYNLDCGKANDPEDLISFLLRIIDSIQRFFPDQLLYRGRGRCYEHLAKYAAAYEDKLGYIQQAIHYYNTAPQTTDLQLSMMGALIGKMEITRQFTEGAFTELLSFFRPVLGEATFIRSLIYQCLRVRALPFEQNIYWYERLLHEFEDAMHKLAASDLLVYLDWAEAYHFMLSHDDAPDIDPGYKATLAAQTALLLKPLEGYYTEDEEVLYRLGKAFADTAKSSTNNELSPAYYKAAVDFFTKSHELKYTIWSFPVYAIHALLDMAKIYHEQGPREKLIATFEHGLQLFSQAYEQEEDFQLNLYWGNFLIAYSGLAYDYKSPAINERAEEKLQLAIVQNGNTHHPYMTHPYFSMARLAIRSGDREKCVARLLQCREYMRSKGYTYYDLTEALDDDDFREVWDQLQ